MSKLQPESETVKQIYEWHEKQEAKKPPRLGRLGASIIGRPCERFLWYSFRKLFKTEFKGRMLRLFQTGHLEEPRLVEELRGIGCLVEHCTKDDQLELTVLGGHFVCYPDAMILGLPEAPKTWHVGEFKTTGGTETQKSKDFEKVSRLGVKAAKPEHYAQMQVGMGVSGVTRAKYIMKKKATDELYGERVKYDKDAFDRLKEKAERVITSSAPLERCASRPDDFRCKFCDASSLCWPDTMKSAVRIASKTCRSCCHATADIEGEGARWTCARGEAACMPEINRIGCKLHLLLPGLVSFADPNDTGDDWIEFTNRDDKAVWRHGNGDGMWTTEELMITPGPLVGDKATQKVKESFDAAVVGIENLTLIDKYPPEDSELLWEGAEDSIERAIKDLDFLMSESADPFETFEDDKHVAWELHGKYLAVIYKGHDYAAIWKGKE